MIQLFQKATAFVSNFYNKKGHNSLTYHNFHHTSKLLNRANELFQEEHFSTTEVATVQLALLFANTGFVYNYEQPFSDGSLVFDDFLKIESMDLSISNDIKQCIEALGTKQPQNKLQQVASDIYYSDFGIKKYPKYNILLRKERDLILDENTTDTEWLDFQIDTFTQHVYYSDYAKKTWEGRKRKNLSELLRQKEKLNAVRNKEKLKAKYKTKYKNESPERGIQTLYRVALRNHIKLSDIADTKANILLSVNAIIISLIIANIVSDLNNPDNRYMILPTIIFVVASITSMVMSIKATQPNVTRGEFSEKDLKEKKVNLAFFGNFHKIEIERYRKAFTSLIQNKDDVYNTLTTDLYYLGQVLDVKYRLLRYTYLIFMVGIIISVIAFAISFIYRDTITL